LQKFGDIGERHKLITQKPYNYTGAWLEVYYENVTDPALPKVSDFIAQYAISGQGETDSQP
jgi:hypothetical protein